MEAILVAAEAVLARDSGASLEQVATVAGVSRATLHRHFPTRDDLAKGLTRWAAQRLREAVERAHPDTAPPLVALHQATRNVMATKLASPFSMPPGTCPDPSTQADVQAVRDACMLVLRRCQSEGHISPDTDLDWARQAYYALLRAALPLTGTIGLDHAAHLVTQTLLKGIQ